MELQSLFDEPPTAASVSYQLAHETARRLELRGEYAAAAELLALALAEEAQRINQQALGQLDLTQQPLQLKGIMTCMAQQQAHLLKLRMPLLHHGEHSVQEPPKLVNCFGSLMSPSRVQSVPVPSDVLDAIASRWHLPNGAVIDLWQDFVTASRGKYTLTMHRARGSLLAGLPDDLHPRVWAFALMDPAASQLFNENEGGAAGLNFEEYLVFRCFVGAETLEDQFRFLWRLYDRDGDGKLGREDVRTALRLRQAQLGWDDAILSR